MDARDNVLLGTVVKPKRSRYALASALVGALSLVAIVSSAALGAMGYARAAFFVAWLQLVFPAAIVLGHLALRQLNAQPGRATGRPLALLGLYIGYFNAVVMALVLFRIFG